MYRGVEYRFIHFTHAGLQHTGKDVALSDDGIFVWMNVKLGDHMVNDRSSAIKLEEINE